MGLKRFISATKDVLGNSYIVIKFIKDDIIEDILDQWVYEIDNTDVVVQERMNMVSNQILRDNSSHHITIINVAESKKIDHKTLEKLIGKEVEIEICGIGKAIDPKKNNEAHFVVIVSEDLKKVRKDLGLKEHDFHITIGFDNKDVFGQSKGKDSIYHDVD